MYRQFFSLLLSFLIFSVSAQENPTADKITRKTYQISKTTVKPKIDGFLDDEVWKNIPVANHFIERSPNNGRAESEGFRTEVKLAYDDIGIYVGAMMYDQHPEKIRKELTERDNIGNDDFFLITFNGYNDKQQSYVFFVTAAGVQMDSKIDSNGEDKSWNGVWSSRVKILDNGWSLEMFIPYSELRFPNKKVQEWGMNMGRSIRRKRREYNWNHIDNQKNSITLFDGILQGIQNIKPPLRLSFYPYASTYVNTYDGNTTTNINGGMDVKYGINEAFTLDVTLIPDFGQASFDRKVLNLGPFEQRFNEQRAFFNEGTDLFTKGGLFYSRRIGGSPSKYPTISKDEDIQKLPQKVKLVNAAKLSGRTSKGLGIGVFHAITAKTEAEIKNTQTGSVRKEIIEPLANYNVLAFNQRFRGNSSISLVNTHVLRNKNFRNSNVTGLYWDLRNKKNTYYYYGGVEGSYVYGNQRKFGTEVSTGVSKISGKTRYGLNTNLRTLDYDINDLGFTGGTNYQSYNGWFQYQTLRPTEHFNNYNINFNVNFSRRLKPDLFKEAYFNTNAGFTTKTFLGFGGGLAVSPFGENDIYEPRENGRHLYVPGFIKSWIWFSTDYRKKWAYDVNVDYTQYFETGRNTVKISFSPRVRWSDRWKMRWNTKFKWKAKNVGFVTRNQEDIVMGQRDIFTIENSFSTQYIFNPKTSLNISLRHYVSSVDYVDFYHLQQDGNLKNTSFINGKNNTYNSWNMDARFSWWFAPGSQLSVVYRNSIDDFQSEYQPRYQSNVNRIFNLPKINNLSLRLVYFLDYNKVTRLFK